ncbi:hypothetical protein LBWT_X3260 (plasmid) [Leptolyngbya boryana IAM M-101]|nr:hypothetical protein LBWT_X3260 [Leptolyngbya boryana IAM M-101]BAS66602.1 hypothetical protein LBDG_X3260 [Leptolyngbya boryana dg5]
MSNRVPISQELGTRLVCGGTLVNEVAMSVPQIALIVKWG